VIQSRFKSKRGLDSPITDRPRMHLLQLLLWWFCTGHHIRRAVGKMACQMQFSISEKQNVQHWTR